MSMRATRITLAVLALLLIAAGVVRGDMHQLWLHATQICLGCIGIG